LNIFIAPLNDQTQIGQASTMLNVQDDPLRVRRNRNKPISISEPRSANISFEFCKSFTIYIYY